jgi:ribosomal protein L12E/L44/L45/RPP1/RPP2
MSAVTTPVKKLINPVVRELIPSSRQQGSAAPAAGAPAAPAAGAPAAPAAGAPAPTQRTEMAERTAATLRSRRRRGGGRVLLGGEDQQSTLG